MTPLTVALAAAVAVSFAVGAPRRPPARVLGHAESGPGVHAARIGGRLLDHLGAVARFAVRRPPPWWSDRLVGAALAVAVCSVVLHPAPAIVVVGAALLRHRRRRAETHERPDERAVTTELPELIDLLGLTVSAGLTVPAALGLLARSGPPALRDDLHDAATAIGAGVGTEEAVAVLGPRWGAPAAPLVHALVDHLRYGTPLAPALDRISIEARARRRRAAETRARRLPVLLLFPLVLCTLPAFGLLTVAPLVAGTLGSLDGSPLEAPASSPP